LTFSLIFQHEGTSDHSMKTGVMLNGTAVAGNTFASGMTVLF